MAVKHFDSGNGVLCNTKAKKIESTSIESEVTCKRCLKKLSTMEPRNDNIKFVEHKQLKYCLCINDNVFLKLGDDINDRITTMILSKDGSIVSTNMRLGGKVSQLIPEKDLTFLKEWFMMKKVEQNNNIYVHDCKDFFGE